MYGAPQALRVDNGSELTTAAFGEWCERRGIELRFIQRGKPDQNAFMERLNRSYRAEVLDAYLFDSIEEIRQITNAALRTALPDLPSQSRCNRAPVTKLCVKCMG
jgi:putative transposase